MDGAAEDKRVDPVIAWAGDACETGPLAFAAGGESGPVRLRYFAPPAHLRPYFGSLYIFETDVAGFADVTRADVAQLRFMLRGRGHYHFQDGASVPTPPICLLGPTLGATRFVLDEPAYVVGVSLLPAGWITLDGADASAMTDRLRDLGAIDPGFARLLEELCAAPAAEDVVDRVWADLATRLRPPSIATWRFLETVDAWLTDEASPRVDQLAQATGLSVRQLERLTKRFYCAPPKLLSRKYRALRCSARIAIDRESWQTLCEDGVFYDQSHFIREIKHFIGLTPHQLLCEPSAVAQLTLLRRLLGGDVAVLNRVS